MSAGELKLAVTANLGALGAKEGPPVPYRWSPPSHWPHLLVPVGLVLLLLPRRNQSLQALWLGPAVALSLGVLGCLWAVPNVGSEAPEGLFEMLCAAVFSLGAVWLLMPYLNLRSRFLTLLAMLAAMELAGVFALAVARHSSPEAMPAEMLIGVTFLALLMTAAINLAAWSCRGRFDRWRLVVWSLVWVIVGCSTFFVVMLCVAGHGPWLEMTVALLAFCAVGFGLLLPFLMLSLANTFYRERLKEVLRLVQES